jgi:hypothetical protein
MMYSGSDRYIRMTQTQSRGIGVNISLDVINTYFLRLIGSWLDSYLGLKL